MVANPCGADMDTLAVQFLLLLQVLSPQSHLTGQQLSSELEGLVVGPADCPLALPALLDRLDTSSSCLLKETSMRGKCMQISIVCSLLLNALALPEIM